MKTKLIATLALTGLLCNGAFANLIVNGSFESGVSGTYAELGAGSTAITGWTTTQSGVEWFQPSLNSPSLGGAADGLATVDLANYVYIGGGIKQSFATTAGQTYDLSFSGGNVVYAGRDGTGLIDLLLNGAYAQSFATSTSSTSMAWQDFGYSFTATGSTTTLEFQNNQNPYLHFAALDKVDVESAASAVPEPGTLALLGLGIMGLAIGRSRRSKSGCRRSKK